MAVSIGDNSLSRPVCRVHIKKVIIKTFIAHCVHFWTLLAGEKKIQDGKDFMDSLFPESKFRSTATT